MSKETVEIVCAECGENDVIDRYVVCSECGVENDVTEWDTYCGECISPYMLEVDSAVCGMCSFM